MYSLVTLGAEGVSGPDKQEITGGDRTRSRPEISTNGVKTVGF